MCCEVFSESANDDVIKLFLDFTRLASCYVRNVPKPTPSVWKISNGDISATGRATHSRFGSTVGLSGLEDRMAIFPVGPNTS